VRGIVVAAAAAGDAGLAGHGVDATARTPSSQAFSLVSAADRAPGARAGTAGSSRSPGRAR
jgi:hypothetical protein